MWVLLALGGVVGAVALLGSGGSDDLDDCPVDENGNVYDWVSWDCYVP